MRYSIEPRDIIYVNGYGFLTFAKNMGRDANKVAKGLSNKYGQKPLDSGKKSAEATDDLIGNKIADKITIVSKKYATELHSKELPNDETEEDVEIAALKKRYISPKERKQIIDELSLIPRKEAYF